MARAMWSCQEVADWDVDEGGMLDSDPIEGGRLDFPETGSCCVDQL